MHKVAADSSGAGGGGGSAPIGGLNSGQKVAGKGILGLEDMLRRLGGLHEEFLETVLLPQMHHAIGRLSVFTSHTYDTSAVGSTSSGGAVGGASSVGDGPTHGHIPELLSKLKLHSTAQSVSNGKGILREVKRATYTLAPVADDVTALQKKFLSLKKGLDAAVALSTAAVTALVPKTQISRVAALGADAKMSDRESGIMDRVASPQKSPVRGLSGGREQGVAAATPGRESLSPSQDSMGGGPRGMKSGGGAAPIGGVRGTGRGGARGSVP